MRRQPVLGIAGLFLIGVTVAAVGQAPSPAPPAPMGAARPAEPLSPATSALQPPRPLPGMATQPLVPSPAPSAATEPPLSRFEPLTNFSLPTQQAVRGVVLGGAWLARVHQPHGRFLYGYNPALRKPLPGDHDLGQARGAVALAQSARFCGDERQAVLAAQTILTLLAATRPDPADPNRRVPVHSSLVCNRVGFAALVALAVYELPGADEKLWAEAERLTEFLHGHCQPDGSVRYTDGAADDPARIDPAGFNEYPGLALHAIAVGNRFRPAVWKTEALRKGLAYYRAAFRERPHPLLAATLTPAFVELYAQGRDPAAAAAVFELNDWLCGQQIPATDPRTPHWAGGFRVFAEGRPADIPPGPETGLLVQSLAAACRVTRSTPDLDRYQRYKAALADAVMFLGGLQYTEATTRHFEASFRAGMLVGGFHLSPEDGNLRVDATAAAVSGLVAYLSSGAEG